MKADFNIHEGTLLLFPCRTDVWREGAIPAARSVIALAALIARQEPVYLGVPADRLGEIAPTVPAGVTVVPMDYDDIWCRDSGAVPVGENLVGFGFNAWGGEDGLCCEWERDATLPRQMSRLLQKPLTECPLTLEGGNLATDGRGTLLAVRETILCDNRNPGIDEKTAERMLKNALNAHRVVWLEQGIAYDETGGHIDNLCAFADENTVLLAWTDDESNPSYAAVKDAQARLISAGYEVVKIPLPKAFRRTEEDCTHITAMQGSKPRLPGEIIQGSYINFVFAGGAVIIPTFDDEADAVALDIFKKQFPTRQVIQLPAREILLGGGGFHCITRNF